jgi:hypothetical protein
MEKSSKLSNLTIHVISIVIEAILIEKTITFEFEKLANIPNLENFYVQLSTDKPCLSE